MMNFGSIETAGLDFNIRYSRRTGMGWFRSILEGTWLQRYDQVLPDLIIPLLGETYVEQRRIKGKGVYDLGVFPSWKFNISTTWNLAGWDLGFNTRFIGGFRECEDNDCDAVARYGELEEALLPIRDVDSNVTSDLFVNYTTRSEFGTARLTVGVNNIFDRDPPTIANGFLANSDAATYSFLGRYFYTRLVLTF